MKLEKDYSYFDSCKTLMKEIERDYRFAFFYTVFVAFVVCCGAPMKVRFQVFSCIGYGLGEPDNAVSILAGGFGQIVLAFVAVLVGYFAWANFRRLNLLMFALYGTMSILALIHADVPSMILGIPGAAMYIRALFAVVQDERICKLEGYPYFNERFELSKQDFEKPPLHPDEPEKVDTWYMDSLTKRTLRGEEEIRTPIQKKEETPLEVESVSALEEILCDKPVYTPDREQLPDVSELSLGEEPDEANTAAQPEEKPSPAPTKPTPTAHPGKSNKKRNHKRK